VTSLLAALWRTRDGRAGLVLLGVALAVAAAGPALLPDPRAMGDLAAGAQPPGAAHWLGTDQLSRDVAARVAGGMRVSLLIGVLSVATAALAGGAAGLVAGYAGGATDAVLMRLADTTMVVPRLFILLLVLAAWDRVPLAALVLVLGLSGWAAPARLVRAEVLRLRGAEFVAAARALGAPLGRILLRHLLPNAAGPLIVAASLGVGDVILLEAGLSFLGLGVRPPTPSLGGMILDAREVLATAPWASLFPGLALVAIVLGTTLLGDALRTALDPREA